MKQMKFPLTGITPLIMHADTTVDPLHEITVAVKKITGKQKKTEDDHAEIARLEFIAGLYWNKEIGPYIPAANLERMLRDGGALTRMGTKVKQGMQVLEDRAALLYDGPREREAMLKDGRFMFRSSVVVKKARTIRVRPWFHDWALDFTLLYDEKLFDPQQVRDIVTTCGNYIGLGEWRPRHGRFDAKVL